MLLIPRKRIWTQQPQQAIGVDWSNPITKGLIRAYDFSRPDKDLARGNDGFSLSGIGSVTRKTGKGLLVNANNSANTGDSVSSEVSDQITVIFAAEKISAISTSSNFLFAESRLNDVTNFNWGFYESVSNGNLTCYVKNSGGTTAKATGGTEWLPNKGLQVWGLRYSSSALQLFLAGKSVGSAAQSGAIQSAYGLISLSGWNVATTTPNYVSYLGFIFSRALSDAEIKSISDNPWQIFKAPDSRIFIPVSAGIAAGANLSGDAQATASATGSLTLQAALEGAALSVASASGNLSTQIPLTGAAVAIVSANGALLSGIPLTAQAIAQAMASGTLSAQIKLDGAALAQAAASAGLTSAIQLAAAAAAQGSASGNLSAGSSGLEGNAQAQATVVATLTTGIRLSGDAAAAAGVSGLLSTAIPLTAAALAQAIASGALSVPILLAGDAKAQATAAGVLGDANPLAPAVHYRLSAGVARLTHIQSAVAHLTQASASHRRLTTLSHGVRHV